MDVTATLKPWDQSRLRLPAAWERHGGTILGFPCGHELWFGHLPAVRREHEQLVLAIAEGEEVFVLVPPGATAAARAAAWYGHPRVNILYQPLDDVWLRDSGPVVVERVSAKSTDSGGAPARSWLGYDFLFNAWGGKFEDVLDDAVAGRVCEVLSLECERLPFVFEGGSIDSNGQGAALTTRQCLLEPHRNPAWTESEIDHALKALFGLSELVWLGAGISGDHTDGHIDTLARFVSPDTVVCHYAESEAHPSYGTLRQNLEQLQRLTLSDQSAVRTVVPLPLPRHVETFQGEYKTMSYANFYCCNSALIVPQFGDPNDELVLNILGGLVTDRKVIGLDAKAIVLGGGVFNCLTQQIPAGAWPGSGA